MWYVKHFLFNKQSLYNSISTHLRAKQKQQLYPIGYWIIYIAAMDYIAVVVALLVSEF